MQVTIAAGGGNSGSSDAGAAAATKKDTTTGAAAAESTKIHAAPAGAAQGVNAAACTLTTKKAVVDAAHVTVTLSPVKGVAGSVTTSCARAAGHDTTTRDAGTLDCDAAPGSAGAAIASLGIAHPSRRERHENGGGVRVGDGVGEGVGVAEGVTDAVGEPVAVFDGVDDGVFVGEGVGKGVGVPDPVCVAVDVAVPVPDGLEPYESVVFALAVPVPVAVLVAVGVGVHVGVAEGSVPPCVINPWTTTPARRANPGAAAVSHEAPALFDSATIGKVSTPEFRPSGDARGCSGRV